MNIELKAIKKIINTLPYCIDSSAESAERTIIWLCILKAQTIEFKKSRLNVFELISNYKELMNLVNEQKTNINKEKTGASQYTCKFDQFDCQNGALALVTTRVVGFLFNYKTYSTNPSRCSFM